MAPLTLSEQSVIALEATFRSRLRQALMSKATYWYLQSNPSNLKMQKQISYSKLLATGASGHIEMDAITRFWLSNYNTDAILDSNNQPTDSELLNLSALDTVYNCLAGVLTGDDLLPIL